MDGHTRSGLGFVQVACFVAVASFAATAHADETAPRFRQGPVGRYVQLSPEQAALVAATPRQQTTTHTIFLNRCPGGLTLTQGVADDSRANVSSIVTGSINLPPYPHGDAAWAELVQGTREMFAPFGVTITDVDPGQAPHDEVVVCGSDVQAGFEGAAGVAPFTCAVIPNAITYVFPETIGNDARFTIETIAQEAAHAWGLDHEFKCEDPMTYLLDCGDKSFQDGQYPCGEYEARACNCGGNTQNAHEHILGLFGAGTPDTQAPSVTITSPSDGAAFDAGADFQIAIDVADDLEVSVANLYVNGALASTDDTAPFGPWPVHDTPEGRHEFQVEVIDAAGNLGTSDVVTIEVGDAAQGDGGEGTDGGDGTDGGGGDDDEDDDGAGADGITGGAIPPGYGGRGEQAGGCAMGGRSGGAAGWLVVIVLGRIAARRRRCQRLSVTPP